MKETECYCTASSVCEYCANDLHIPASPPERPMRQSIEELLERLEDASRLTESSLRDDINAMYADDYRAARSALLAAYNELEAETLIELTDPLTGNTIPVKLKTAYESLRSRIAELEAECCEAEDVGYSCTEPAGHSGFHVASGLPRPYHTWPAS